MFCFLFSQVVVVFVVVVATVLVRYVVRCLVSRPSSASDRHVTSGFVRAESGFKRRKTGESLSRCLLDEDAAQLVVSRVCLQFSIRKRRKRKAKAKANKTLNAHKRPAPPVVHKPPKLRKRKHKHSHHYYR